VDLVVDLVVGEIVDLIVGEFAVRVVGLGKKTDLAKMLLERRCLRTAGGCLTVFLGLGCFAQMAVKFGSFHFGPANCVASTR